MNDLSKQYPIEGSNSSEDIFYHVPRDPSSGRFIVADILPPGKPKIQLTAVDLVKKVPVKKSTRKSAPLKQTVKPPVEKNPLLQLAKKESLDAWFQKRKNSFDIPATTNNRAPSRTPAPSRKRAIIIGVILLIIIGSGIYGFGRTFAKVYITVGLKSETHTVNQEVIIATDGRSGSLPGEIITISHSKQETFVATGEDAVEAKAKGVITIYNAFSSQDQNLVANTRFEASDGKIYRIKNAITVPGATIQDSKVIPNAIDVTVYADAAGETYNKDSADFTIPGFKGSPRFEGFYARTKTPLAGGFIGTAKIVTGKDRDAAEELLENMARTETKQSLKEAVPEEFILLDDSYEILNDEKTFSAEAGDVGEQFTGSVIMEGRAVVFRSADLGTYLANTLGLPADQIRLANPGDIAITVKRRSITAETLVLEISGPVQFLWNFSEKELQDNVIKAPSSEVLNDIFASYPAIERAEVRFSPNWIQSIPADPKDVVITQEIKYVNP